ncbi:unnamed protein product [Camellia sinensis]
MQRKAITANMMISCFNSFAQTCKGRIYEFEKTSLFPPLSLSYHCQCSSHGCQTPNLSSISLDQTYITRNTMQDFIDSVRRSLVFKPSGVFGGFFGIFSKPPVPALPPIAKSDAIKVKKDDAPPIRWMKGELIGCGAFARVYMGLNINSGVPLAIKQVSIAANSASKEKTQ